MKRAGTALAAVALFGCMTGIAFAKSAKYEGSFPSDANSGMELKAKLDGNKPKTVTQATWFNTDATCDNASTVQQGSGFRAKVKVKNREFAYADDSTSPAGALHIEIEGTFARNGKTVSGTVTQEQGYFGDAYTCTTPPTEFELTLK